MKLKLKNFRCYSDKTFDFGQTGLVLLSGPSGSGKTTIMSAIMFALYDIGTKLVTIGKTSCEVILEFSGLWIQRTKRPNRLVVKNIETEEEFEDDAAQSVINEKFGSSFSTTSYIPQNTFDSFIMMTPTQKLEFLEGFAFQGLDLEKIKERCKEEIKTSNNDLISISSQLSLASSHLQSLKKPEKVKPLGENFMKNEPIRLKNKTILIKKAERELETLNTELTNTKLYSLKKERNEQIKTKITDLEDKLMKLDYNKDLIFQFEKELDYLISNNKLITLKTQYERDSVRLEEMVKKEDDERLDTIAIIEKDLWVEYSKDEIETLIIDTEKALVDYKRMKQLEDIIKRNKIDETRHIKDKQQLEQLKTIIEALKTYQCPSCQTFLQFEEEKLKISVVEQVKRDASIDETKRNIVKLEKLITDDSNKLNRIKEANEELKSIKDGYEEFPDDIEYTLKELKEYNITQLQNQKKKMQLEQTKTYSTAIQTFKNQLCKTKDTIERLQKDLKREISSISEDDLRSLIYEEKEKRILYNEYEKQIKQLECELYTEEKDVRVVNIIEDDIANTKRQIDTLKNECLTHESNIKDIEKYLKYKEDLSIFNSWEKKITILQTKETECKKTHAASTLLKEKILEAESLAINNIVNSINLHAQEYLDIFFPNEPITIRLNPFKTDKKQSVKPQINLEIDYKGITADISMLSGGETARVILAYSMALSEITNPPLIMLDESTASLDQEATSVVMEGIKKNFSNKLVIVIAHQVISGEFDRQILL
jgi:DNA repair exonuclease SbcCD ATPase subunit